MKTLILTAALVATATFAMAQKSNADVRNDDVKKSEIEVAVLQHSNDEVTLLMEKESFEPVRIKVYEGNKLLYSKRIKKEATANITFDISAFPEGNYVFKVIRDKEVVYTADVSKGPGSIMLEESESLADSK